MTNNEGSTQAAHFTEQELLAIVTNELRIPLTSITGYNTILLQSHFGPLTAQQTEALQITLRQARYALYILDITLLIQELKAPKKSTRPEKYSLSDIVHVSIDNSFYYKSDAQAQMTIQLPPDNSHIIIDKRLASILLTNTFNLVFQYTQDAPQIKVSISTGDMFHCEIQYTDEQNVVYQSYRRRSQSGIDPFIGIIPQILQLLGGSIEFLDESRIIKRVIITFPLTQLPPNDSAV